MRTGFSLLASGVCVSEKVGTAPRGGRVFYLFIVALFDEHGSEKIMPKRAVLPILGTAEDTALRDYWPEISITLKITTHVYSCHAGAYFGKPS